MGTPDFAVPALQSLHTALGVRAVVTLPDKQKGRGLTLQPTDVAIAAADLGISTVLKPQSLKDPAFVEELNALQPDIICVIAFRILPEQVYSTARLGAFNVHASLLPKYRGAAPINWAIINGDRETGVTSFLLNNVVDTGTVLLQRSAPITDATTAGDLYNDLKVLAAQCALDTCNALIAGGISLKRQEETEATLAPKVFRTSSAIDWSKSAADVRNFIHGMSPVPCAWTTLNGETVKIYRASLPRDPSNRGDIGTFRIVDGKMLVSCADAELSLIEVQLPGKRKMMVEEFMRGYRGPSNGRFV